MTGTVKMKLHLSALALGRVHRVAHILVLIYYFELQVSGIKFSYESW